MEIQAETQAEYNRELQREKMRHEESMAARQAFEAFRDRLLELRMEYLDDPDRSAKKARVSASLVREVITAQSGRKP